MSSIPTPRPSMDDTIRRVVAEALPGQVVGHFELIVEAIDPDDPDAAPRRLRWSPRGSSPHLSLGLLTAAAHRIERQLDGSDV